MSYFFPITKRVRSKYSGELEITYNNGRKVLDTLHTNYSYGSLQRILKFGLKHVDLQPIREVLVLGLGGGSVLETLRKEYGYRHKITAVDIDPVIIQVAADEFGITTDEQTVITCADAFDFVIRDQGQYDLIIVDLFIDNRIPEKFLLIEFWRELIRHVSNQGQVIVNTLCDPPTDLLPVKEKFRKRGFDLEVFRYVEQTNKLLVAKAH